MQSEPIKPEVQEKIDELVPAMAAVIDEHGGLCRLDMVTSDARVRRIRNNIPEPYKRITKLLTDDEYTQYFTLLDDSDKIATALAYEKGLVNPNGELTDEGRAFLEKKKQEKSHYPPQQDQAEPRPKGGKGTPAGKGTVIPPKSASKGAPKGRGSTAGLDLHSPEAHFATLPAVLEEFGKVAKTGTDEELQKVFTVVQACRWRLGIHLKRPAATPTAPAKAPPSKGGKGKGKSDAPMTTPTRPEISPQEPAKGPKPPKNMKACDELLRLCVKELEQATNKTLCLSYLAAQPDIKATRQLALGKYTPFKVLFETVYPDFFQLENKENNQMYVILKKSPPADRVQHPRPFDEETEPKRLKRGGADGQGNRGYARF